jgi:hypothetical protein
MDVREPVRVREMLELAVRQVDAQRGVAVLYVVDQARGDKLSDVLLSFFCCCPRCAGSG